MILDPSEDRTRLEREVRVHKRLRELLLAFSRGISTSLGLTAALESLTPAIRDLAGARMVEIWLHDRRNRRLVLAATSADSGTGAVVPIDDTSHYAAAGLRLDRARMRGAHLVAPLRGWRRALGTLVIEKGPPARKTARGTPKRRGRAKAVAFEGAAFLEFARELARQLSVGIENVLLLDDILRQRRLLEDTFNSLIDLVVVVDRELRIVQTNEAFAARVGLKRTEMMRRPLRELVGPETFAYVEAADTWQGVVPAVQRRVDDAQLDGTFVLTATPLTSQDGQTLGRVLVARDITRQTRLEAERAALRERLAQSEKLASLGQFVAGIAHEMNNPLQGVLGHLELLIEMTEAARPVRRELKQIFQEADRAAKIVKNLLVFTGTRKIARQRMQIDRILTRALASRTVNLQHAGIKIVRKQGKRLPPVLCDPLHLQQAFLNILINAEHAIGPRAPLRRIEISTKSRRPHKRVTITIRDTGAGIPSDALPRIFDPFFTTKEVGRGAGLGLAITYGIVQEHGGTIAAANAADGGAVFQIELPAAPPSVGDKVNAGSPTQ
ncbi:MAG TPA: ATP-binding protein [Vicinamibacterales bacterium]|nr:ATP-binding protein [Vicinamibacterales bacterium]